MTNDECRMAQSIVYEPETCAGLEMAFWDVTPAELDDFVVREDSPARVYDLEERTAIFAEKVILFAKKIPWGPVNNRLIDQLVGAATSIGANYCEADDGVSRRDFKNRIGTCRKESRETKFFLRMVATSEPKFKAEARELWKEAHSFHRIFSRIWRSTNT
jgi:four helix bundle protein